VVVGGDRIEEVTEADLEAEEVTVPTERAEGQSARPLSCQTISHACTMFAEAEDVVSDEQKDRSSQLTS
jgi:hypothetical protein